MDLVDKIIKEQKLKHKKKFAFEKLLEAELEIKELKKQVKELKKENKTLRESSKNFRKALEDALD